MNHEKAVRQQRIRRRFRVRKRLQGTSERPRLSVHRSHKHIYCQVIDDAQGKTLALGQHASSKDLRSQIKYTAATRRGHSRSARRSPSERWRPESKRSVWIAAVASTMDVSPPWPMPFAKAAFPSETTVSGSLRPNADRRHEMASERLPSAPTEHLPRTWEHRQWPQPADPHRRDEERTRGAYEERVVKIKRCAAVVKGGRRFSFAAMVVVGDREGRVGWGYGKANEVPPSVEKAVKQATRNMITRADRRGDDSAYRQGTIRCRRGAAGSRRSRYRRDRRRRRASRLRSGRNSRYPHEELRIQQSGPAGQGDASMPSSKLRTQQEVEVLRGVSLS